MAKSKNPKNNNPKSNNNSNSKSSNTNNTSHNNTKNQKNIVVSSEASTSKSKSTSPHTARKINLSFPPIESSELEVILEESEQEEEDVSGYESERQEPSLRLTTADVEGEITYWSSAVYCYILGANPPSSVITGYVKRVWQSYGIDRISFLPNGIFLVRFKSKAKHIEVVNNGHLIFDNKPVIVKEWSPDSELIKHDVKLIPIWMKLYGLDIKFWGTDCLRKISGLVGKMMRCDDATSKRAFLGYARIMVEVQIGQQFPTELEFVDELGKIQRVKVVYDWLPLSCDKCKGMGHEAIHCRKIEGAPKRVWKPKVKPQAPVNEAVTKPRPVAKPVSPVVAPPPVTQVPSPVMQTPVVVPLTGGTTSVGLKEIEVNTSFPRRFISKMMKHDNGEPRVFTPRGLSFMDALTLSVQKARTESRKLLTPGTYSDNGTHVGGRVWLLWDPQVYQVDVLDVTAQCIHSKVFDKVQKIVFWHTLVYGFNRIQERASLWDSLRDYSSVIDGPWLLCGDFNSITGVNDRVGGAEVSWAEMAPMRKMIVDCQLQDMKSSGSYYTWNNKHEATTKVYSRIDRVLINEQWFQIFPEAVANYLPEGLYDHCPCLINSTEEISKRKMGFKYFNMWALSDDFESTVKDSWQQELRGTPMYRVVQKLKRLKPVLKNLNKAQFSDIENLTNVTELALKHFQQQLIQDPMNDTLCNAEKDYANDLIKLVKARNSYLAQKAKEAWIKDGDDNTSFFHSSIKRRRMKNRVYSIHDMEGVLCSKPDDIKAAFEDYYRDLLLKPVSDEEIKSAMFSIPGDKAPGPDGFSSQFFKDSWHIVGREVCKAIRNVFDSGQLLKELNTTTLTLVPKVDLPDSVLQFRPIACCNTVYKCLTKVLCNRLSLILPDIINPSQGAFVKDRDIVGNILICQDLIKLYKRKVCSPRVMLKIDLQKAYDSIEWSFLNDMLCALEFPPSFITLIMACVTSPTFSLALNGEVFGFFRGQRGLRGDLHSVRLLLRAFETFSASSGLKMNNGKSNIYKEWGEGGNYEEVTERIARLGAKHLSYAGRLTLIKSVLSTLHNYWARIFILPKTVLNSIDAICEPSWHGQEQKESPALVSWNQVCKPRRKGGLGLKSVTSWNIALMGKYVWWVEKKNRSSMGEVGAYYLYKEYYLERL
ncbi:uncharacterized protein LOC141629907 [Silene latifolia]|uniref:uncharacterized protein LOC141629907 n=1 Tax=Silene latifolia TaxID=37657 RepID=UPI003D76D03F